VSRSTSVKFTAVLVLWFSTGCGGSSFESVDGTAGSATTPNGGAASGGAANLGGDAAIVSGGATHSAGGSSATGLGGSASGGVSSGGSSSTGGSMSHGGAPAFGGSPSFAGGGSASGGAGAGESESAGAGGVSNQTPFATTLRIRWGYAGAPCDPAWATTFTVKSNPPGAAPDFQYKKAFPCGALDSSGASEIQTVDLPFNAVDADRVEVDALYQNASASTAGYSWTSITGVTMKANAVTDVLVMFEAKPIGSQMAAYVVSEPN